MRRSGTVRPSRTATSSTKVTRRGRDVSEAQAEAEAESSTVLRATLHYSKWTQGIEQVRRRIAVVNAP